jgi:aspartyl-tRNA(Asn)/glutamyl-tRNA(Gln) amidotransferase subunit A
VTPSEIVARALAGARELAARKPSVGPILDYCDADALREAELATARYRDGKTLGSLDGIPVVIKEQMSVRGLPRRSGTRFADTLPCAEDGTVVERLRAAGAIVLGTSPMTEYGMTPTGANPHRQMPRNPHATDRLAGGSSTGSGVAVASGLVPFAVGVDGGGSIRIPAATNGVFGIKPTWGRVSRWGDSATGSVAHVGPLGASTLDLARMLEVIAGADPKDPETTPQPEIPSTAALRRGVRGLTVGLPVREWEDADAEVSSAGHEAVRALEREGATVAPIEIGMARYAAALGLLSIGVEALGTLRAEWRDHADDMSLDLQVSLSALGCVSAAEYADAQRLRTGLRRDVARAFERIDVLVLPALPETASRVTAEEMKTGFVDSRILAAASRFSFLGNLTGLPALSCPIGLDRNRLPIGFQLVGDAWDEATLLATSAHLERIGVSVAHEPEVAIHLL